MITTNATVLDGIVLYHPMIEIWSGTVRVKRAEDLKDASDLLPPPALVSDGRKSIVRKDPLRPLLAIRKKFDRLVRSVGFGFMGGIAIPLSELQRVEGKIPQLEAEFNTALDTLCLNLEDEYRIQEELYPQWGALLQRSRLSEQEVRNRCRFDVICHQVTAPRTGSNVAASRFNKAANAALPELLNDIAQNAHTLYERSVKDSNRLSSKTVAVVRRMVAKLESFSFLDPRVDPMAKALNQMLQGVSTTGFLTPVETAMVASVVNTLCDPETLISQGAAAIPTSIDTLMPASTATPAYTNDMFDAANSEDTSEEEEVIAGADPIPTTVVVSGSASPFAATF